MAYVLTYTSLETAIQQYIQRSDADFLAQIPLFIMLGQRRVARDLKILGMRVVINGSLTSNNPLLQKPTRWCNTSSFNINIGTSDNPNALNLPIRTYDFCTTYWPQTTQVAQPKYVADYNQDNWYIVPTPDQAYNFEISYFQVPELIDDTVSTNFMTTTLPDLLLTACLIETAPYLIDDARIPMWLNEYKIAKDAYSQEDILRLTDNYSTLRGGV